MADAKALLACVTAAFLVACGGGEAPALQQQQPASAPPVSAPVLLPNCTPRQATVALMGDSTMFRLGDRVQAWMDTRFGPGWVLVTNYGFSGTRTFDAPIIAPADIVAANYGINDMRHEDGDTAALFGQRMAGLHLTLVETQSPVVYGQGTLAGVPGGAYDQDGYVAAAMSIGLPVADTYHYVLSLPNWQTMIPDGVHPDDKLMDLIVQNVLGPALARQVAPIRCEVSHG